MPKVNDTPKNYAYRMDHDTGFAPNIEDGICTLSGCKKATVELWAKVGSWIIGIGGNNTGKPDKLIYAMEVEKVLKYPQFKKLYPRKSKYLQKEKAGNNVLLSKNFYYFGDSAIDLPEKLKSIIIKNQGCKCIYEEDIDKLREYIKKCYGERKRVFGKPNNFESTCGMGV